MSYLLRVADEEASHAAAAATLDLPVTSLWINPYAGQWINPYDAGQRLGVVTESHHEGSTYIVYNDTPRDWRKMMLVTLAPLIERDETPAWPLSSRATGDDCDVADLAGKLQLDRRGYARIVADATRLIERPGYKRLQLALSYAAVRYGPTLHEPLLSRLISEFAMNTADDYTPTDTERRWAKAAREVMQAENEAEAAAVKAARGIDHSISITPSQRRSNLEAEMRCIQAELDDLVKDPASLRREAFAAMRSAGVLG